jgi:hypothetical protein
MFNFDNSNPFLFGNQGNSHPQFSLIKKHIERSVQDLFLTSLREQPEEMVYVFVEEDQIEKFKSRMLTYWEKFEEYEICQEVSERIEDLKERWKERDTEINPLTLEKIKSLFD